MTTPSRSDSWTLLLDLEETQEGYVNARLPDVRLERIKVELIGIELELNAGCDHRGRKRAMRMQATLACPGARA